MSIKQQIIVAFTFIVAAILLLFSFFVYYSYEDYRQDLMYERLFSRAEASQQIIKNQDKFRKNIFLPLNEQYEAVFDAQNKLIASTDNINDYTPDDLFFKQVRSKIRVKFSYANPQFEFEKEGVALMYLQDGKPYVAMATAYDLNGHNMSNTLRYSLFFGNVLALFLIAIIAYFFSKRAMKPFDVIINQIDKADIEDLDFRIYHSNEINEANTLAKSFNQLLKKIQKAGENQKHFISYASHELRTPLTVIKGILQTSLAYNRGTKEWKQSTKEVIVEVNRTIDLANNLLLLAEVEGLQSKMEFSTLNVLDLVMDSIAQINQKYPDQKLNFKLGLAIQNENTPSVILGISHLLRSALINIIDNACKYSNFQEVDIFIDRKRTNISIQVKDKGTGISENDKEIIFMPMMRGSNIQGVQGFGVGLTLVQKIIQLHHGKIELNSSQKLGTRVNLEFPLAKF